MVDLNLQQINNRSLQAGHYAATSTVLKWIMVGGLFVSLSLGYAWIHNEILTIRYQMERIKNENVELADANSALRAELNALIRPEEIEEAARRLNLISSNQEGVTILEADRVTPVASENLLAESLNQRLLIHE